MTQKVAETHVLRPGAISTGRAKHACFNHIMSIIALHGLDATSPETWIGWKVDGDPNSGDVNWLEDKHMLPRFMPDSRILTYQWNANYDAYASSDRFSGHATSLLQDLHADRFSECRSNCPIIFIVSCFGGLLLAQALVIASHPTEPGHRQHSSILRHTIGAAFLGTPFGGSPLDDLANQFGNLIHSDKYKFPVMCVYETRHTDLSAYKRRLGANFSSMGLDENYHGIVVDSKSATISGMEAYGFDVRHNMLHKFNDSNDVNFKKIRHWLVKTADIAGETLGCKASNDRPVNDLYDDRSHSGSKSDTRLFDLPGSRVRKNPRKPEAREKLYNKLHFKTLGERYKNIWPAHRATCKWLLKNKEYQAWLDKGKLEDHHGVLWLKGNPGTGKSTLMKFAVSKLSMENPKDIHIFFFFNARGDALEQSTVGMYQSLLHQLFSQIPRLKYVFDDFAQFDLPETDIYESWALQTLESLLMHAISELGSHKLWVFVDALDEGNEKEVRKMITFFGGLGKEAKDANVDMRVLFASRHYPQITISHKVEIILESEKEHYLDIKRYVQSELYIKDGMTAQGIQDEVINRASGFFLWVVLVVEILNETAAKGMNQKEKLKELPDHLSTLFEGILTRDRENMKGTLLCIQWVLFSRKPLTREELYYAILHGANEKETRSWAADYVTIEIMDAFILTCSKGLVQFSGETAQFIHETVRDFLIHDNGMQLIASDATKSIKGAAHDTLKSCCLNCISSTLKIIWGSGRPVRFDNLDRLRGIYDSIVESGRKNYSKSKPLYKTPFLHYALFHLLHHANAAEAGGVSQVSFIQAFQLRSWVYLRKVFLELGTFNSLRSTFLYTLAEEGLGSLIMAMLHADPGKTPHLLVEELLRHEDVELNFRDAEKGRTPMWCDAEEGYEAIVKLLLERQGVDVESKDTEYGQTPLCVAARFGHREVVRLMLVSNRVVLGSQDLQGQTAWTWAIIRQDDAMMEMLGNI
ncbi:unnamed protein product [Fusarium graminearum]|uniref:Chromosome 2, complete genome n=2 Tax=Gibberella zeae (strain ATCC MYA-4620 / CBS 123657 / FGSC 9075 / NRRL 31084 / PH-1) TaxID=229533 RepID=A0A098DJP8_GIBZE|nr:unnamed protein product [Fusarium graminearum]